MKTRAKCCPFVVLVKTSWLSIASAERSAVFGAEFPWNSPQIFLQQQHTYNSVFRLCKGFSAGVHIVRERILDRLDEYQRSSSFDDMPKNKSKKGKGECEICKGIPRGPLPPIIIIIKVSSRNYPWGTFDAAPCTNSSFLLRSYCDHVQYTWHWVTVTIVPHSRRV